MSKQLNVSETPVTEMNVNIIGNEQQYVEHNQDINPTDVTLLIENPSQYVQPEKNEIIINKFPDQNAFDSQTGNLTWSDLSIIYEDNDFVDKSNMFVYFHDYDGSVAYKYNIDEFFVLDELPPLPDHSDKNKICDGWNWTLQEIRNYLEEYPADINVGCTVHCGNNPELGSSHVRFYNHEGEVLYDYTAAEVLALSELPALPDLSSINRVADGWNWTLSEISAYLHDVDGDVNVGYTMSPGNNPSAGSSIIRFYDYEGTLLHEYTAAQFLALSELPSLPDRTSENLTCDGWNWTLDEITSHLNTVDGDVNVGAIYHTTDDKTHITCKPTETFPQAYICLTPTASGAVTVDWGDGTTDTWDSASQETKSHTYTGVTDSSVYDITISCSSGMYSFNTSITGSNTNNPNCVYTDIKLSNKSIFYSSIFQNCYSLQTLTIPSSVTYLGENCFQNCYSLKSINIPSSVTRLSDKCFQYCYSLKSITIPSGITSLGSGFFSGCYSLQSLTIPSGVASLGNSCFMNSSLKSITIPSGVISLGNNCFMGSSLQSINIPSSITSLGSQCFSNCFSLQSITIPSGVEILGNQCFYNCTSLQSLTIPSGVTSLGNSCFNSCCSLQSLTIPSGVTSLGSSCFYNCSSLQSLTIPSGVTSLGSSCFYNCSSLQSLTIPSGVESLDTSCFNNCASLQFITIPSSVTSLGTYCFYECYSLKSIAIPSSVTSFGNSCFNGCYSLKSIAIPSGVTSLGTECFSSCRVLQFVTIPDSVTSLGNNCFNNFFGYFSYTSRFMYMKSTTPPTLANTSAIGNSTEIIYVPTGTGDAYKGATNWSTHSSKIVEYNNFKKSNSLTTNLEEKGIIFNKIQTYNNNKEGICILDKCYDVKSIINFYDYDGVILYSFSKNEFLNLTNLPELPDRTSENLTCDGWNWTLSEIVSYLNSVDGDVNVGAIYHTADDKTHITCKPTNTFTGTSICLQPTVANAVTVDWGDGTTDTWTSTSVETKSHTYTNITSASVYDITISCSSGTYKFDTSITGTLENNKICAYTDIKLSNKVTSLGGSCFNGCRSLKSIAIPSSVTRLSDKCFQSCSSLQSLTIPSNVNSLGRQCFYNCSSLQSIAIPSSVEKFDDYCFYNCSSLQSLTIPSGVESLSNYCFNNCYSLKSIAIPKNITSFGNFCFSGCVSLQTIDIPSSVESLGNNCFLHCNSLKSIVIPNSVTRLGSECFYQCTSLQYITMSSNATNLGYGCFRDCNSLKSITIPSGVEILGNQCFYNCYSLQSITIPSGVSSLGSSCFYGCSSLQTITIPSSVSSLGSSCFYGCSSLQTITIPSSVSSLGSSCFYGCSSLQTITIPSGVISLGNDCFNGCRSLQSITIPSGVTSLGSQCFRDCYSLQYVVIPDTITSLGSSCFYNCYTLQSINIPSGVTSLSNYCFYGCDVLQFVTIPSSVESLDSSCFYNCSSLKKIYMQPTTPPTLANTNAIPSNANLVIYVPTGTLTAYQTATNWSSFASKMFEED